MACAILNKALRLLGHIVPRSGATSPRCAESRDCVQGCTLHQGTGPLRTLTTRPAAGRARRRVTGGPQDGSREVHGEMGQDPHGQHGCPRGSANEDQSDGVLWTDLCPRRRPSLSPGMPEGFCAWAWADIRKDILTVVIGGNMPGLRQPGTIITGCTDWFRPVIFKVERVENA